MNFEKRLETLKKGAMDRLPKDVYTSYEDAITDLKNTNIENIALKEGDKAPNFTLKNHLGNEISLNSLLEKGPVVIKFYRGGWCPYCNLELRSYMNVIDDINRLNGTFIAISPETPDNSLSTIEKNNLKFDVLSDTNNLVSKEFKIAFRVPDNIASIYESRGMSLSSSQDNNFNELPLPALYIIDTDRTIKFAFINADYKERLSPHIVIEKLEMLHNVKFDL